MNDTLSLDDYEIHQLILEKLSEDYEIISQDLDTLNSKMKNTELTVDEYDDYLWLSETLSNLKGVISYYKGHGIPRIENKLTTQDLFDFIS